MKYKFITIGEIMLRLTPPDYEKIRTATSFEARYGGSEANVALSLANLGVAASFFTVVPGNSLGKSAVRMLRSNDVNCDSVVYSTEEETPTHRLGTYYLETGYGIRPSKVVYDRKHSAFSEYDFSKTDVKKLLEGYTWLHLSGITPALGKSCSELILTCLKTAKENAAGDQCYRCDSSHQSWKSTAGRASGVRACSADDWIYQSGTESGRWEKRQQVRPFCRKSVQADGSRGSYCGE